MPGPALGRGVRLVQPHDGRGLHSSTIRLNLSKLVTVTTLRIQQKMLTLR